MTQNEEQELSLTDKVVNRKQQLFTYYIVAILIDLTVLNLFNEFLPKFLYIDSFSFSLFAAIILQVLLQITLKVEHKVADYFFKDKSGLKINILRGVSAWTIIFISKLVMLKAITISFGTDVAFGGPLHGVIAFVIVIATMIVSEQIVLKIHHSLSRR